MKAKALLTPPIAAMLIIATVTATSAVPVDIANAPVETGATALDSDEAAVQLINATPAQAAQVADAQRRFLSAGLVLPPLQISFHDGAHGCLGHRGLFEMVDATAHIDICDPTNHIIRHELAHAWVGTHVDDTIRAEQIRYWGLATWNDQDSKWNLRANERAADAIAFALDDPPQGLTTSLVNYLCAFELLTGLEHPGLDQDCPVTAITG